MEKLKMYTKMTSSRLVVASDLSIMGNVKFSELSCLLITSNNSEITPENHRPI